MAGYCEITDLVMGQIPLPSYIDPQKQVDDARDEIDSYLGYLYETPFDVVAPTTLERPALLLLKRINSYLATGRLILAIASPEENRNLHAYGWQLVSESLEALKSIASGEVRLEGAAVNPDAATGPIVTAPLIDNLDSESNVEAFYDRIANPNYGYFVSGIPVDPDRFVQ